MALTKAIEQLKTELKAKQNEVAQINKAITLLETSSNITNVTGIVRRRTMSPEAIEKIRVAQKKRWAAIKGSKKKTPKEK